MGDFPDVLQIKDTAVLFIEFQNEFASEGGRLNGAVRECMEAKKTLENASELLANCRQRGVRVIHAPITFADDFKELSHSSYGILKGVKDGQCFVGSQWGGKIIESMSPLPSEVVVSGKIGLCAFSSTNLDFLLRQLEVKNLAVCGFLTNCCVESSMRTAYEKGFKVITLPDCCAATSVEAHDAAEKFTFGMFSIPLNSKEFLSKVV
jgi:nicotinamidase-related amidase